MFLKPAFCCVCVLMLKGRNVKQVVGMGPPSFLSLGINSDADRYLWVAVMRNRE